MDRVILSLQFDLERVQTGERVQLIAPLDARGLAVYAHAAAPKARVIDLRPVDSLRHGGTLYRVIGVRAYREARVAEDVALATGDGYRYRLAAE
jgi:hypothetical protein